MGMRPSDYTRKLLSEFQLEKWKRPGFKDKMRMAHMGERCHWWKGGITPVYFQIRGSTKYDDWRRAVFERDNYQDWFSGLKGSGNLNADHITPLNVLIKKHNIKTLDDALKCDALWDVNNGVTMIAISHLPFIQRGETMTEWDTIWSKPLITSDYSLKYLSFIRSIELPYDAKVIEVGCGTGQTLNMLCDTVGFDISLPALNIAK